MKSLQIPVVLALFTCSLAVASAQKIPYIGAGPGTPGPAFDPRTGMPTAAPPQPTAIDPTTGLPIAAAPAVPDSDWKDPDWRDPEIVLTNVNFEGVPFDEIAKFVREQFKGQIDVILPSGDSPPGGINLRTGMPLGDIPMDLNSSFPVRLQLRNVTASELFNAMNLIFENDTTPLRWELKLIGKRQVALLRMMIEPVRELPHPPAPAGPPILRRVYFVGDLIGDEKSGGMTMEQIIKTITDVWNMAGDGNGNIKFHKDAQLLVVTSTPDQVDFMEQTLKALEQRVNQAKGKASPFKPKISATGE